VKKPLIKFKLLGTPVTMRYKLLKLSEAFLEYIAIYVAPYQSQATVKQFRCAMQSLKAQEILLKDLDQAFIISWQQSNLRQGKSANTIRGYTEKLRKVLRYHRAKGADCLSPDLVHSPPKDDKNPEWLTPKEVDKFIKEALRKRPGRSEKCRLRNGAIISTLYSSGLRIAELAKLNIEDIRTNSVSIIGKNKKHRIIFIDNRSRELIKMYLKLRKDSNPALFVSTEGNRIDPCKIREAFRLLSKPFGKRVHPHSLRHSYATNLLNNGCHIYTLQRLMGHSNIISTQQYLHLVDKDLEESYQKFHSIK
jgi:integrase/recombinase XerD